MIRWRLAPHLKRKGWTSAYQLARGADLTMPLASRLFHADGQPISRLEIATLEALARAFRVRPWALLEYLPDE